MAPLFTDQPVVLDAVHPLRVVPSNIETRFGSPYGGAGSAFAGVMDAAARRATPAASTHRGRRNMALSLRELTGCCGSPRSARAGHARHPIYGTYFQRKQVANVFTAVKDRMNRTTCQDP